MDLFAAATCDKFGLAIKAVVMYQPSPDAANVNGAQLQVVDNFTYLGRILSRTTKIDNGVSRHLRTNCSTRNTPGAVSSYSSSSSAPTTNTDRTPEPPLPSCSSPSSIASTSATAVLVPTTTTEHNPDASTTINPSPLPPTTQRLGLDLYLSSLPPHLYLTRRSDRPIENPSHEQVVGAPTYTRHIRPQCPAHLLTEWAYSATCVVSTKTELTAVSTHLAHLAHPPSQNLAAQHVHHHQFNHTQHIVHTHHANHTQSLRAPTTTSSTIPITKSDTDIADFSCPHCPRTFTSRIGLVGH
ncbi:hypothetical protein SprV_1002822100 [Sparganum proliferum]